jgi:hypothetical protein
VVGLRYCTQLFDPVPKWMCTRVILLAFDHICCI